MWLYRALSFLVISCPCALVISIPLTFFAGIGGASGAGVLVKGANFLETLAKTTCVVFDKTGTLTRGDFTVTEIVPASLPRDELLELAALAEIASSHPIAKSVRAAWGDVPDRRRVTDIRERSGRGITARVDGRAVAAGNRRLMEELSVPCPAEDPEVGAVLHIAVEGQYAGRLTIADQVKPTAREAVAALDQAALRAYFQPETSNVGALAKRLSVGNPKLTQTYARHLGQLRVGQFLYHNLNGRPIIANVQAMPCES